MNNQDLFNLDILMKFLENTTITELNTYTNDLGDIKIVIDGRLSESESGSQDREQF